ncbi:MAG: DNA ligase D [Pricia sp.]
MNLEEYNKKRNFSKTPEPEGGTISLSDGHRFVVQRHDARRLHYDLRLEIDGTLKSWAVPKGPSMNPSDKRLAVRTEDHPIKYLHFEGNIPKGNYGAGDMAIWDSGIFGTDASATELDIVQQLEEGNLKLVFHGQKIQGRFALVRTGKKSEKEQWLLIKKKDSFSTELYYDADALIEPSKNIVRKRPSKFEPGSILQPMLASSTDAIFNDPNWIYELKWDGYRVLAHIWDKGVLLQSRNGVNYNAKFKALHDELKQLDHEVILDGEVVILDENGVSQFGELQNYPSSNGILKYYVFDMLFLNGHSMLDLKLPDRKSLIPEVLGELEIAQYCDHIEGMGTALYEKALGAGMEGVMAKAKDSTYTIGARTENWLKIKSVEDIDALICGYTDSEEGGTAFGSLILGVRQDNRLKYIGNCGSGFSESRRYELLELFDDYRADGLPFPKKLQLKGRRPHWMHPVLECEVSYSEKTKNGLLRNPVFKGLKAFPPPPMPQNGPSAVRPTNSNNKQTLEVDGLQVPISHLEKVYWPEAGLKKYDLIDYYLNIAEVLLPHLVDRPQSLHRHPNGIADDGFYQKDNDYLPEWMQTVSIYSESSERSIDYLLCQNTASLLYMANMGCIEINPWNSKVKTLDRPDYGIIDLDPPVGMGFEKVVQVAVQFKEVLESVDVEGYCKLSGSKGIHIYLPMGAQYTYEEVRNFIKLLCLFVEQRLPDIATLERRIKNRKGKIYLDYLQNRRGHTIASVYSVRPLPGAPVSTPITWEELQGDLRPQMFMMGDLEERLRQTGDLFEPLLHDAIDMEKVLNDLDTLEDSR